MEVAARKAIRAPMNIILMVLLLVGLPLLGIVIAGQPLDRYLEFPPRTHYVQHAPFSWRVFIVLAFFIMAPVALSIVPMGTSLFAPPLRRPTSHPLSWWGWLGAALTTLSWALAWNRFTWFESLQPFTFTPLWLGYIMLMNAWTFSRRGRCIMLNEPRSFLWLFPLSSAFWWFFEYLNRFVQNWGYIGVQDFTPWEYFFHATLSFSTVLPAVLSTTELLASYARTRGKSEQFRPIRSAQGKMFGRGILLLAAAGLTAIGIWPSYLFPLVWVAPLLLISSLQTLAGEETIFSRVGRGDWKSVWLPALAALVCGFFWEMWNFKSLSHWEYAVPFVHRFQIFEMPLLGYAGYLPFGLECVAVAQLFLPECCRDILIDPLA